MGETHDFKIGDRVRTLVKGAGGFPSLEEGKEGTVTADTNHDHAGIRVKFDRSNTLGFFARELDQLEKIGGKMEREGLLTLGQHIYFTVNGETICYTVDHGPGDYYLFYGGDNARIFNMLGLDPHEFCRKYYKDTEVTRHGIWPWANTIADLERAIEGLRKVISEKEGGKKMKEEMGETSLKVGDKVNFTFKGKEYEFEVMGGHGKYLLQTEDGANCILFRDLSLNAEEFCDRHYTLPHQGGDWPEAQTLEDLERVISALRDEIHRQETKQKEEKVMSKSLTIDDIEVGDHIEILDGFEHPAMKPGAIVECVEINTDKLWNNQIRTTFAKGTPHAGETRPTHPFPYTNKNRERGCFRIIKNKEDGMRSKDILIDFMMGKQAKMGMDVDYFNVRDMRSIEEWSDRDADKVLQKMKEAIESGMGLTSLRACPFCFYHDWFNKVWHTACKECDYAKVHGKCNSPGSDYRDANRICRKHDLEVGDLVKKLQKEVPAPQTLKMWASRSEDDHPKQVYICFDDKSGDIHFYACDKDGSPIDGGNLFHFDKNGGHITLCASISRDIPGIDRDPAGQIKTV